MIQMLRQEACSGQMHDLAHVLTQSCLADPLTKKSVSPTLLISTVQTGILREVDTHLSRQNAVQRVQVKKNSVFKSEDLSQTSQCPHLVAQMILSSTWFLSRNDQQEIYSTPPALGNALDGIRHCWFLLPMYDSLVYTNYINSG